MNQRPKCFSSRSALTLLVVGTTLLSSSAVFALASDRQKPISLEAERATFNEKTGVTTYTGNVVIQQGTLKLEADAIVANLNSNNQIKTVTANGSPAKFQQQMDSNKGLARGEGKRINYNAETGIISLSGNAFLSQNGATFRGENLKYSMSKGDIQADGGSTGQKKGRIQIVIPPSAQQSLSGVND